MIPNLDDTIVALASASGPGMRGIVRLSGPRAHAFVISVVEGTLEPGQGRHRLTRQQIRVPGVHSLLPADVYLAWSPRSYTGQDTAEIHTISSPPLLEALIATLLNAGARAALPGEFTLRAFLAGRKDLPQAEAVLGVIEAATPDELKQALAQMAGGVTQPLHGLRDDLLNLLADVEAALDFVEEDIEFVAKTDTLLRISKGLAQITLLQKQLDERALSSRPFRVALIGEPNAGKSSLFNALAGLPAAIVSPVAGTTRDYLTRSVQLKGTSIELIDTAGWQPAENMIEEQAQSLGKAQTQGADLLLWCFDVTAASSEIPTEFISLTAVGVATKCDLRAAPANTIATSARAGAGITDLLVLIGECAASASRGALAPSLSRCRHHVEASLKHLRAAHHIVLFDDPAELLALELRLALEQIGAMIGAVHTDDLLDRVFSRFCIGK